MWRNLRAKLSVTSTLGGRAEKARAKLETRAQQASAPAVTPKTPWPATPRTERAHFVGDRALDKFADAMSLDSEQASVTSSSGFSRFDRRLPAHLQSASEQEKVRAYWRGVLGRFSTRYHEDRVAPLALKASLEADGLSFNGISAREALEHQSRINVTRTLEESATPTVTSTPNAERLDRVLKLIHQVQVAYVHTGRREAIEGLPLLPTNELQELGLPGSMFRNVGLLHDEVKRAGGNVYFAAIPYVGTMRALESQVAELIFGPYGSHAIVLDDGRARQQGIVGTFVMREQDLYKLAKHREPSLASLLEEADQATVENLELWKRVHALRQATDFTADDFLGLVREQLRRTAKSATPEDLAALESGLGKPGDASDVVSQYGLKPLGFDQMELRHPGPVPSSDWRPLSSGISTAATQTAKRP